MARRGKTRGARLGPRSVVALLLLGFVVVATGVIARRTYGISQARALRMLEQQRDALDADRVKLSADIREAASRQRLVPIAEQRLHMYVPPDSQVVILRRNQ